jgi:hypothetical protein
MGIRQIVNKAMKGRMRDVQLRESNNNEDERIAKEEYPKMPAGFACYVCGTLFATNEERKQHLEKYAHGDMYDTASPQEREDIRRFSNTLVDFNKK